MTCPEGCISGGGQPKVLLPKHKPMAYENRISGTYQHDSESKLRKSHENPAIKKLYKDFLKILLAINHMNYFIQNIIQEKISRNN